MWLLISALIRAFCSSGKLRASKTTARSALASVATAVFALSKVFQTSTAMNPTNSAKETPATGNKPGDTALKARAHSVSASRVTTKYTPPAMRKVATKIIKAIHNTGRMRKQSATEFSYYAVRRYYNPSLNHGADAR